MDYPVQDIFISIINKTSIITSDILKNFDKYTGLISQKKLVKIFAKHRGYFYMKDKDKDFNEVAINIILTEMEELIKRLFKERCNATLDYLLSGNLELLPNPKIDKELSDEQLSLLYIDLNNYNNLRRLLTQKQLDLAGKFRYTQSDGIDVDSRSDNNDQLSRNIENFYKILDQSSDLVNYWKKI